MNKKKQLIVIVGPTTIGKTNRSIEIATHFQTEIISADSRQFYKEMVIGTAVPSIKVLQTVPHHFIQHLSIFEDYSVGDFERDAIKTLNKLFTKNDVVVLVGGSGLYVDAIVNGLDNFPKVDTKIRKQLNIDYEEKGIAFLQEKLQKLDIDYYKTVDLENPRRLIRALEICMGAGKSYSSFLHQEKSKRNFTVIKIGLTAERNVIYERINKRTDKMIAKGLVAEAKALHSHKNLNALQTVGYKELFTYFDGNWTLDFAISEIKKNTRRFAKRQLTWFKRDSEILWFDYKVAASEIIRKIL